MSIAPDSNYSELTWHYTGIYILLCFVHFFQVLTTANTWTIGHLPNCLGRNALPTSLAKSLAFSAVNCRCECRAS
jgi:hypothetical protein